MEPIDTTNRFLVGVQGEQIAILKLGRSMSKDDALNLAAYLVALADDDGTFPSILAAVQNT